MVTSWQKFIFFYLDMCRALHAKCFLLFENCSDNVGPLNSFFFFFYILYVFYVVTNNISFIIFKSLLVLQSHLPNIQNVSGITSTKIGLLSNKKKYRWKLDNLLWLLFLHLMRCQNVNFFLNEDMKTIYILFPMDMCRALHVICCFLFENCSESSGSHQLIFIFINIMYVFYMVTNNITLRYQ